MSKGSGRRPAAVSEAEIAARWEKAFAKGELFIPQDHGMTLPEYMEYMRKQESAAGGE